MATQNTGHEAHNDHGTAQAPSTTTTGPQRPATAPGDGQDAPTRAEQQAAGADIAFVGVHGRWPGSADERESFVKLRAILEDRYDGLLMHLRPGDHVVGDTGRLLEKLDSVLWELFTGTVRRGLDDRDDFVDELEAIIRERIIDYATAHPTWPELEASR